MVGVEGNGRFMLPWDGDQDCSGGVQLPWVVVLQDL